MPDHIRRHVSAAQGWRWLVDQVGLSRAMATYYELVFHKRPEWLRTGPPCHPAPVGLG